MPRTWPVAFLDLIYFMMKDWSSWKTGHESDHLHAFSDADVSLSCLVVGCWAHRTGGGVVAFGGWKGSVKASSLPCQVGSPALKCWQPVSAAVLQQVWFNLGGGTDSTVRCLLKTRRMQLTHQSVKMVVHWVGEARGECVIAFEKSGNDENYKFIIMPIMHEVWVD